MLKTYVIVSPASTVGVAIFAMKRFAIVVSVAVVVSSASMVTLVGSVGLSARAVFTIWPVASGSILAFTWIVTESPADMVSKLQFHKIEKEHVPCSGTTDILSRVDGNESLTVTSRASLGPRLETMML